MELNAAVREAFEKAFPGVDFGFVRTTPATDPKFGDYQCNDALKVAKRLGMPPREVAAKVAANLDPSLKVEVAGPGFLNLTVSGEWLATGLSALAAAPSCGIPQSGAGKRIVIDYSSPNAAKQMHIGHIRSTVIGNAIDRIFRSLGYEVIADNHLGDWGTQFGILIKGYRECLTDEERNNLTVANLEKCYVLSAAKAKEEDGVWKDACRAELVKLQQGDADNLALWKKFIDISIAEFERMYAKLGVKFDTYRGESYYNDAMPGVVENLVKAGLAVESDGALVVNLEAEKLGVAIVRKSDGGYNYTTSDLACVESRVREYSPERIIYVTDARQQLHFKQWFSIAAKTGCTTKLVHVPFGLMSFQGKAISTREGNLIRLDELLAEAKRRAYVQYAYARVCSLLEKAGLAADAAPASFAVETPLERRLALHLLEFPGAVVRAAEAYKPSVLADYLFQAAQLYSSFYQNSPILKSDAAVRDARLSLCALFGRVLKTGLGLLGMETPSHI